MPATTYQKRKERKKMETQTKAQKILVGGKIMTRIATGMALLLLLATAGCGGDDGGGSVNPFSPTGVVSSPMDTTNAQSGGGLTNLTAAGMRSAKPDKNTVDFSGVNWEWNEARSHLEPDSFPDARVNSGSNVWHRDSGTGLIRIFSDADLSGMSFMTAGSSWPLSMRKAGLYVSDISGADVERIRAGGGTGGRVDEPTVDEPTVDKPTAKNTVDFSGVNWEWNEARSHLEPDSFPDARVNSGSNVWHRDSGTGLIRIFSDEDLSGMSFMTAGSSWPLSMRGAGLYVSDISGADVERIRAGGGTGGRADEPTTINCWASEAGKEVTVDAVGASIEMSVEVTCDRSIDLPDDEAVVKTAAGPSESPDWIDLNNNRYALRVPAGRSVYVDVILYPNDNGTSARVGNVVWPPVPPGEMSSLSALVVHQPGRTVSANPPIILRCLDPSSSLPKRPGPCPDRVEVGATVSLRAIVTPLPSGYVTAEVNGRLNGEIECGVGKQARTCGWRISQVDGSGTPGRFESGDSVNLTWRAPSSPGSVTIGGRYQLLVQGVGGFFPVPEHWSDNKGDAAGSNTLTFNVIELTPPPDLRPHLSCDNGPMDSDLDRNETSCDSIDGADVAVTLTVTRPNGTTVSSLLYDVEWDVKGGGHVISSSHPTATTSRAHHLLTWSSTGLTTGDQGVVVAAVRPNGYDHAFNSTQVTIVVK